MKITLERKDTDHCKEVIMEEEEPSTVVLLTNPLQKTFLENGQRNTREKKKKTMRECQKVWRLNYINI